MKLDKITEWESRRRYDDACGAAHALDLIGERWALLVVRELFFGPKRFTDLRKGLPGISANVLTQRLEGLEAMGLVLRRRLPPPASVAVYELTPWGYESEPIFQTLGRWAARSPLHDPALPISNNSLMLSFRTMFDPARAGAMQARIGFVMDDEGFTARIAEGVIEVRRDNAAQEAIAGAEAAFIGPAGSIGAFVYGAVPPEQLPNLDIRGDRSLAKRFATLFPLPAKVGAEEQDR
jgi:DNA-binding HxlR family transcriptional regulator